MSEQATMIDALDGPCEVCGEPVDIETDAEARFHPAAPGSAAAFMDMRLAIVCGPCQQRRAEDVQAFRDGKVFWRYDPDRRALYWPKEGGDGPIAA